jgi:hypothetical protein
MLNKILISIVFFAFTFSVNADELKINPDHPDKYVVVKGDTLWDISGRFLEEPWRWPEIWNVNPQISNPHLIYPGDVISLSYQDGKPVLQVERGMAANRNVKLSPEIRVLEHEEAIPTIPVDAIQQFLERPLVLDDDEMTYWPYVVSSYDQHLIAASGNTIYIRGIPEGDDTRLYSIYRKGEPYVSPTDEDGGKPEILGYEAIYVGDAIIEKAGDPASATITSVDREVLTGDRLVPQSDEDVSSEFIPRPTATDVDGRILSVVDGVSQIGQYQIIVLNLGTEQGVEPGNVLGIYQSGKVVKDKVGPNIPKSEAEKAAEEAAYEASNPGDGSRFLRKLANVPGAVMEKFDTAVPYIANKQDKVEEITLPEEYVGVAMIFRTFNKVSYALVMETEGAVHVYDTVKSM